MRVKTIVLAAVAVGAAFGAATLARDWLETQQQALQAQLTPGVRAYRAVELFVADLCRAAQSN